MTFILFLSLRFLYAQSYNEQFEFRIDNDQFIAQDRYYTSGLFITYKRIPKANFLFSKKKDRKIQYEINVGQQIYTPQKIKLDSVGEFDRPYAGWLHAKFKLGRISEKSGFFIGVEAGVTGEPSQARRFQNWVHRAFSVGKQATWVEQIAHRWLYNVEANYFLNLLSGSSYSFLLENYAVVGRKDIFIENGINLYLGRFQGLKNSSRLGAVDSKNDNELMGLFSFKYRFVEHNALIEGSISEEDLLFTTSAVKHIFKWQFGFVYRHQRNTLKFIYSLNSKETNTSSFHGYGSIVYGLNF
ncbi:MAG: DUF2219 family protein [Flavobacteriaceae bacterium]|nr:DUF2219 family protein [Flavobacteriaceae bacterium]